MLESNYWRGNFCIEVSPAPGTLVIFGASGDLAKRKLFPALFHLFRRGLMHEESRIVGCARSPLDDKLKVPSPLKITLLVLLSPMKNSFGAVSPEIPSAVSVLPSAMFMVVVSVVLTSITCIQAFSFTLSSSPVESKLNVESGVSLESPGTVESLQVLAEVQSPL